MDQGHREAAERVMEVAYRLDPFDWQNCCEFGRAAVRNGHRDLAAFDTSGNQGVADGYVEPK